ncbi:MAG: 3'(2'),5'-bisphosphate nucleotidase CysQ, partial [Gammaproteobacteria bacterium]|nr:3'(2'),5'-bisphosphate nucleotidase CysQ [Gammaproteobacteria bacterium]
MLNDELVDAATGIAIAAGKEILDVYQRPGEMDVTIKADNSPLTEADQRAHNVIVAELAKLTPEIPILSEESGHIGVAERRAWVRYWLVDPLDGTKEFIKRNGEFTVNIALIDQGRPVMGIVHVPVSGETYRGLVGSGASKQDANGINNSITCKKIEQEQSALKVVSSRSHRGKELDGILGALQQKFPDMELVSMGSSLKICLVAEGKADLYPRLAPTCEWDTASAHAVLAAAGGIIVNTHFQELLYNQKDELLNPFFIAIGDS